MIPSLTTTAIRSNLNDLAWMVFEKHADSAKKVKTSIRHLLLRPTRHTCANICTTSTRMSKQYTPRQRLSRISAATSPPLDPCCSIQHKHVQAHIPQHSMHDDYFLVIANATAALTPLVCRCRSYSYTPVCVRASLL